MPSGVNGGGGRIRTGA